jgi:hypothetical protein
VKQGLQHTNPYARILRGGTPNVTLLGFSKAFSKVVKDSLPVLCGKESFVRYGKFSELILAFLRFANWRLVSSVYAH